MKCTCAISCVAISASDGVLEGGSLGLPPAFSMEVMEIFVYKSLAQITLFSRLQVSSLSRHIAGRYLTRGTAEEHIGK